MHRVVVNCTALAALYKCSRRGSGRGKGTMSSSPNRGVSPKQSILSLDPNELSFVGPVKKDIKIFLIITNQSEQNVLFKLKSNIPDCFSVAPNHGSIKPKKIKDVTITVLAGKDGDLVKAGMIIEYVCVAASKRVSNVLSEFESQKGNRKFIRIPCKFIEQGTSLEEPPPIAATPPMVTATHHEATATPTPPEPQNINEQEWARIHHELYSQIQAYEERFKVLQQQNKQLSQDYADLKENIAGYEDTIMDHKKYISQLEEENKHLTQEKENLIQTERNTKLHLGKVIEEKFALLEKLSSHNKRSELTTAADQNDSSETFPYDPNLKCPMCGKQFRVNELQVAKQHLDAHPLESTLTTMNDD